MAVSGRNENINIINDYIKSIHFMTLYELAKASCESSTELSFDIHQQHKQTRFYGLMKGFNSAWAQTHGMFVFGDQTTYASHLPMFHEPHNYQVLLEIELKDIPPGPRMPPSDTLENYDKIKKTGHNYFTIEPQPFDLEKLISGEITAFKAKLYQDHFERGGKQIGPVIVKVVNIIYAAELSAGHVHLLQSDEHLPTHSQPKSPLHAEDYLVFGKNGEYFAAHVIAGQPSYDQIVKVAQPTQLDFPSIVKPCKKRWCDNPAESSKDKSSFMPHDAEASQAELVPDSELPMSLNANLPLKCYFQDKIGTPPPFYCEQPPTPGTKLSGIMNDHSGVTKHISTQIESVLYLEEDELKH
jgi:hypothetical protein